MAAILVVVAGMVIVIPAARHDDARAQADNQRQHDQRPYACLLFYLDSFASSRRVNASSTRSWFVERESTGFTSLIGTVLATSIEVGTVPYPMQGGGPCHAWLRTPDGPAN